MSFSRFSLLVPPVLLAALLSACAAFDPPKWLSQAGNAPPPTFEGAPASRAQTASRPVKPSGTLKALRPAARPNVDKEVAALAPPVAASPKLVGLSEEETAELLGRPAEETTEPPGKIWRYKAAGCQLSVHLFPDMERGGFYALDYTADGAREACLGKVAGEARKKGGGAVVEESAKPG